MSRDNEIVAFLVGPLFTEAYALHAGDDITIKKTDQGMEIQIKGIDAEELIVIPKDSKYQNNTHGKDSID